MFAEMELEWEPWSGLYCFVPTLSHYIHFKCTQVGTIPIIFTGRAHITAPYDPSFCIQAHSHTHKCKSGPRPLELRESVTLLFVLNLLSSYWQVLVSWYIYYLLLFKQTGNVSVCEQGVNMGRPLASSVGIQVAKKWCHHLLHQRLGCSLGDYELIFDLRVWVHNNSQVSYGSVSQHSLCTWLRNV